MGLRAGWLALFVFVWIIGAFLGSTFEYQSSASGAGQPYTVGAATFTTNSAAVVGNGTTWVVAMEGGNIKEDADGVWCKILDVSDGQHLTLYNPYPSTGGINMAYTMAVSPGWAGTGTGGYTQSPTTTFNYLLDVRNAFVRIPWLGNVPTPWPNSEYFNTMIKVVLWRWSFLEGYAMFYWIFCAPFVVMGVLSLILLGYGLLRGNLTM